MNIRELIGFETTNAVNANKSRVKAGKHPRTIRSLFAKLRRNINNFIDGGLAEETQLASENETMILPEWMVEIRDQKGSKVYYEPLRFCKTKIDDPSSEILYIGRSDGMAGDIQIKKSWAGAQYVGRNHAVLVRNLEDDAITLYEDDAKNKIFDNNGNSVHSVSIQDGTSVSLAGVIRMNFIHLGRAGVAKEELKKKELRHKDFDSDIHLHRAADMRDSVPYNWTKHSYERS